MQSMKNDFSSNQGGAKKAAGRSRKKGSPVTEERAKAQRAKLDAQQLLNRLGIDSLMSVELKNRIGSDLNVVTPVTTFLQGITFEQLITQIMEQI